MRNSQVPGLKFVDLWKDNEDGLHRATFLTHNHHLLQGIGPMLELDTCMQLE